MALSVSASDENPAPVTHGSDGDSHTHSITIGMPVLNGAAQIGSALEDFMAQTYPHWKLVVCDNASDDATPEIVRRYAAKDPRIVLKRFETRVNVFHSFIRALECADSRYFMFAPSDDRHYPRFLATTLAALDAQPDAVAACPQVAFVNDGVFDAVAGGTSALTGSPAENITAYLANPHENSRLFSVFRTQAVQGCWPEAVIPGIDYHAVARILRHGPTLEVDEVLLERDRTPQENYVRLNDRLAARSVSTKWFPNLPVARAIWRDTSIPNSRALARALAALVLSSFVVRMEVLYPRFMARWRRLRPRIDPY